MPQASHGVYRCPSCDELTEADVGKDGSLVCAKCGHVSTRKVPPSRKRVSMGLDIGGGSLVQRNVVSRRHGDQSEVPSPSVLPEAKAPTLGAGEEVSATGHRQEVISDDGERKLVRRHKKRRRANSFRYVFLLLWVMAIVLIVLMVRKQMGTIRKEARLVAAADAAKLEDKKEAQARAYLEAEMPACRTLLFDFLSAADPAQRAQFVLGGSELAPKMAVHYRQNTIFRPEGGVAMGSSNLVLWDGGKPVIETSWMTEQGERIEAVFARENQEWKLDWEAFVRFSSQPWHLFVSGVGGNEGEFRVWLKVQRNSTTMSGDEQILSLRFYPPVADARERNRAKSEAVLVPLDSRNGRRILEIMEEAEQESEVGDRRLCLDDPANHYRVRVVLEWREGANDRRYLHLKDVLAGHWLGDRFEQEFKDDGDEETREEDPAPPEDG